MSCVALFRATKIGVGIGVCLASVVAEAVSYKAFILPFPSGSTNETISVADVSVNQQVGFGSDFGSNAFHALLWNGPSASVIDLHPAGFRESAAYGVWQGTQVGHGRMGTTGDEIDHALMWKGTPESYVDLHPTDPAFSTQTQSIASAVRENAQVGLVWRVSSIVDARAVMWHGTAESAINLHPVGYFASFGEDLSDTHQVGAGQLSRFGDSHALLWNGSAESVVDLHPAGYLNSSATAVSGNTQVGAGAPSVTQGNRALMWHGTAESVIDLNPPGFNTSIAYDVADNIQVGDGSGSPTSGMTHALRWNGNAHTVVDLHNFLGDLPVAFVSSTANAIDVDGTIVGTAFDGSKRYPIVWVPIVPEPNTLALFIGVLTMVTCLHRCRIPG